MSTIAIIASSTCRGQVHSNELAAASYREDDEVNSPVSKTPGQEPDIQTKAPFLNAIKHFFFVQGSLRRRPFEV